MKRTNPSKLRLVPVFILVTLLILAPLNLVFQTEKAEAAINQQINYQGKLTDSSGDAVADSTYSIVFSLYTTATGGVNIWTETQSVTATSGLFSVMLGSVTSLSTVDFNQTLYLGVNVEADGEMTPRKVLGAVPASFESLNSDKLDGLTASDFLLATTTNATATITTLNVTGLNVSNSTTTNATTTNLNVSGTASTSALIVSGNASLQTITSGTWNGNTIGVAYGGTGLTTYTQGDLLYASGPTTLAGTSTTNLKATLSLNNVENTALSTWAGSTNLTTLGTIATGVWNGTIIGDAYLTKTGDWTGTLDGQEGSYYLNASNLTNFGNPFYTYFSATTTDALTQGSTNLYYADTLVNAYLHASTTIAKAYSDNTFTGSNIFNGALTIASLNGPLQANGGVVSATTSIGVIYGGTGLTSAPAYGEVLLGNGAGGYTLTATTSLGISGGGSGTVESGTTGYLPYYASSGTTLTATSSLYLSTAGNFGIGTTTPTYKLTVKGADSGVGFTRSADEAQNILIYTDGTDNRIVGRGKALRLYNTNSGQDLRLGTDASDRLTIQGSEGDVGIATTSPWGKLSVTNTGSGPSFVVEDSTSPDSTPFIVDASGNVGIGTASPSYKLDISDTSANAPFRFTTTDSSYLCGDVGCTYTTTLTNSAAQFKLVDQDNSVARATLQVQGGAGSVASLWVASNGQVGIGTESPTATFEVKNAGSSTNGSIKALDSADSDFISLDPNFGLILNRSTSYINNASVGGAINIRTSSAAAYDTTALTVISGGNVGIGDTTPAALLTVGSGDLFQVNNSGAIAASTGLQVTGNATITGTLTLNTKAYTWPASYGSSGYYLQNNGSGTLSWAAVSGSSASGSNGQVQYNSGGSFSAEADFFYDSTYNLLGVASSSSYSNGGGGIKTPSINSYTLGYTASAITYISSGGSFLSAGNAGSDTYISIGGSETAIGAAVGGAAGNVYLAAGGEGSTDGTDGSVFIGSSTGSKNANLDLYGDIMIDRSAGTLIDFKVSGTSQGSISSSGTTISYNAFTGSHYAWTNENIDRATLVRMTGDNRNDTGDREIIYGIEPTTEANDPSVLGAYLAVLDKETNSDIHLVMAVGNGDMWVVDNGENLQRGDYLISSDTKGHAMKDLGNYEKSYVIARVAEDINWENVTNTIDGKKHILVSVFFENFVSRGTTLSTLVAGGDIQATEPLVFDIENGEIKVFTTLDFQGNALENIKSLASFTGSWSISEEGVLIVDDIHTNKLTVQSGVTTQDKTTGEYYCIYVDGGILKTEAGKCEDLNLTPPDSSGGDTGGGSTDGNTGTTTATTTEETTGDTGGNTDEVGDTPPPEEEVEATPVPTPEPEPEVVVEAPVVEVAPEPVVEAPSGGEVGTP